MSLVSRTTIPDASSSVYREKALSASDWEKVLGWARFMQIVLNKEARLKQQQEQPEAQPAAAAAQPPQEQPSPGTERKMQPIRYARVSSHPRRRASGSSGAGTPASLLRRVTGRWLLLACAQQRSCLPKGAAAEQFCIFWDACATLGTGTQKTSCQRRRRSRSASSSKGFAVPLPGNPHGQRPQQGSGKEGCCAPRRPHKWWWSRGSPFKQPVLQGDIRSCSPGRWEAGAGSAAFLPAARAIQQQHQRSGPVCSKQHGLWRASSCTAFCRSPAQQSWQGSRRQLSMRL